MPTKTPLDLLLALAAEIEKDKASLALKRRRIAELRAQIEGALAASNGAPSIVPKIVRIPAAIQETLDAVREAGGAMTAKEFAAAAELSRNAAWTRMWRARQLGLLRRKGHGCYELSSPEVVIN